MLKKQNKYISQDEALAKLQKYCAYQDRCHQEVRSKLLDLGVYGDALEEIIAELIQDNFLNEERFARSYARGKFRIRQWGRNKIKQELKFRRISDYCLRKAMEEITEEDYEQTLEGLIEKKWREVREKDAFKKRAKIANYLVQKGYETPLIWPAIKRLTLSK